MPGHAADRNLLFGLLALQNGMIDQSALVSAFQAWTLDKSRLISELLISQGTLDGADRELLDGLVARHLKRQGGDVEKSLAALPAPSALVSVLAGIGDPQVNSMLSIATRTPDILAEPTDSFFANPTSTDGRRFRLLRPHAKGGLGAVFVALDGELNREVALKQILDHHADDPSSRTRFVLEAEITGGLEHPGIVPVYGLGNYGDGRPYYAMRFVRGDSLKEAIASFHADEEQKRDPGRRSLALRGLLRRFVDICNAIEYAHTRGVLHRDIKPANVIVGKHGETLVVDWGLAKPMGKSEIDSHRDERTLVPSSTSGSIDTLPGSAIGTPAYMSPEQSCGDLDNLGPRSDVYSLGATLYSLLTGHAPFEGSDLGAILRDVQKGDFPPPRKLDPAIDRALEAICLKAMALKPEDRFTTARALVDDIEEWMADEPVSAYREPLASRIGRWARRHRPLVAGAAALLFAAVIGLGLGTVLLSQANARTEAQRLEAEANFTKAREAVNEYFTKVSESKLLNVPGLQPLRKELLDSALHYYQGFLREHNSDPTLRAEAGAASYRVSMITSMLGTTEQARPPMEVARSIYEGLTRAHPSVTKYWVDFAMCDNDLGLLYYTSNDREMASRYHREALEIRQRNACEHPDEARFQDELVRSLANLSKISQDEGRMDEAMQLTQQAVEILERVTRGASPATKADLPTDLGKVNNSIGMLQAALASTYQSLARIQSQVGRSEDARRSFRKSLAIADTLLAADPDNMNYYAAYASLGSYACSMFDYLGWDDEAIRVARKVKPFVIRLSTENPSVPEYKTNLALLLDMEGMQSIKTKTFDEAVLRFKEVLAIYERLCAENPQKLYYQDRSAAACRHLGMILPPHLPLTECLGFLRRGESLLQNIHNPDNVSIYDLACTQALIVDRMERGGEKPQEVERYVQKAIQTLNRAIQSGYKDLANLRRDTDLDALRTREDFKTLLAALDTEAKVTPLQECR